MALSVAVMVGETKDWVDELVNKTKTLKVNAGHEPNTDVGPVIDAEAQAQIEQHIQQMAAQGHKVHRLGRVAPGVLEQGTFVLPTVIEIDSLSQLQREVFGPVLHVLRYARRDLQQLIAQINATGYGLTLGVHTRIDETIATVVQAAHVGNLYVNRNMVGAVVGVQPFGGENLSGTGPKAGGPLYMYRLLAAKPADALQRAMAKGLPGSNPVEGLAAQRSNYQALLQWLDTQGDAGLAQACRRFTQQLASMQSRTLLGPTGERNTYMLEPREAALCWADTDAARLFQTAAALAADCKVVWPVSAQDLHRRLPQALQSSVTLAADWTSPTVAVSVVLYAGSTEQLLAVAQQLAQRPCQIA